jgi:hypothetical protein
MDRPVSSSSLRRHAVSRDCRRHLLKALGLAVFAAVGIVPAHAQEMCGGHSYPFPFTDVSGVGSTFCPGIMEAYVTGISKGTTTTTFSPNDDVPRVQMTTFLQRATDQVLSRSSRRAAFNQWWTPQIQLGLQEISLTGIPQFCAPDGQNIWVTTDAGHLVQIAAGTGVNLAHWTGASGPGQILVLGGKIFLAGTNGVTNGILYVVDPTQAPGPVTTAASNLGAGAGGIAFDGTHIWTANLFGSVSIITPAATTPYPPGNVTNVTTGFLAPLGILYDGTNIWVTDHGVGLLRLDDKGNILQTVSVGNDPDYPVFDGENIWVPNVLDNSITVVQASTGNVVATITADATNLLDHPSGAAFDGQRVLVTNINGMSVSVFKAADLSFIANLSVAPLQPTAACSDAVNFWVAANLLLRF